MFLTFPVYLPEKMAIKEQFYILNTTQLWRLNCILGKNGVENRLHWHD